MIFNPIYEFEAFNRLIDSFFNDELREKYINEDYSEANIFENKDGYILEFLVPGIKSENLSIDVNNGILTITAKRDSSEVDEKNSKLIKKERISYNFIKSYKLIDGIDIDKIEAKITNGVLMIYLPKKPEAKPKQISVKVQ